ncbi:uncharacterized protein LOC144860696 [Branchiostoma floridae x Branchiostoma japonicum]
MQYGTPTPKMKRKFSTTLHMGFLTQFKRRKRFLHQIIQYQDLIQTLVYQEIQLSWKGFKTKVLPPKHILKLEDQEESIVGNLTCMRKIRPKESQERISCFHNIMEALEHLSSDDLTRVAERYITPNPKSEERKEDRDAITDALGAMATDDSLYLLTTMVLKPKQRDSELVLRALFHLFGLERPAPVVITN